MFLEKLFGGKKFAFISVAIIILSSILISTSVLYCKNPDEKIAQTVDNRADYDSLNQKVENFGFADIVEDLTPAVVNISTTRTVEKQVSGFQESPLFEEFRRFFGNDFLQQIQPQNIPDQKKKVEKANSLGSGFIIDKNGFIITNNHVIDGADEIFVQLDGDEKNGKKYKAKIVGIDKKTDIALLKIDTNKDLPFVKFGDSSASRVGDWVVVIGNPYGLGGSVTKGIISAKSRNIGAGLYDNFIQTDASINKGNSGGPMFNMKGEVIAVSTAIFSPNGGSIGIGFGIASSVVKPIVEQLKKDGKVTRGWLGVKIQPVNEEIVKSFGIDIENGALVSEVLKDSPAEKAGIIPSDIITEFDEKKIQSFDDLPKITAEIEVGKNVKAVIYRNGKLKTVNVKIGKMPEDEKEVLNAESNTTRDGKKSENGGNSFDLSGMVLIDINQIYSEKFEIPAKTEGVVISKIDRNSKFFGKGLAVGDVIQSINQNKIRNLKEFSKEIVKANKSIISFLVKRKTDSIFISLKFDEK